MIDIITKDELVGILEKTTNDLYMSVERGGFDTDEVREQIADKIISKINEKIGHKYMYVCGSTPHDKIFDVILLNTSFDFGVLEKVNDDKYILTIEYPNK